MILISVDRFTINLYVIKCSYISKYRNCNCCLYIWLEIVYSGYLLSMDCVVNYDSMKTK